MYNCAVSERILSIIFAEKGQGKLIRWLEIICSAGLPEPRSCPGVSPRRRLAHVIAKSYPVQPIIRFWDGGHGQEEVSSNRPRCHSSRRRVVYDSTRNGCLSRVFSKIFEYFLRGWAYYIILGKSTCYLVAQYDFL